MYTYRMDYRRECERGYNPSVGAVAYMSYDYLSGSDGVYKILGTMWMYLRMKYCGK